MFPLKKLLTVPSQNLTVTVSRRTLSLFPPLERRLYNLKGHKFRSYPAHKMRLWEEKMLASRKRYESIPDPKISDAVFEHRRKTQRYRESLRASLNRALIHPDARERLAGHGICVTGLELSRTLEEVAVLWVTTKRGGEAEAAAALDGSAALVREIMDEQSEIGTTPRIVFRRDLAHVTSVTMEEEFERLMEREGTYLDAMASSPAVSEREDSLDEVCRMTKGPDPLGVPRQQIIDEVTAKLKKARATHRVSLKPGLHDPPQEFSGYHGWHDGLEEAPVKRFLADRRRAAKEGALPQYEDREPPPDPTARA